VLAASSAWVEEAHRRQEGRVSEDPERLLGEVLSIQAHQDQSGATIVLAGEFDVAGSQRFWSFVSEALAARPKSITVDARGVEFIDSSALMALVRARDTAAEAGVAFRVSEPSPAVRRIAEVTGLEDLLGVE
jgi:anti-anti-sigma factor